MTETIAAELVLGGYCLAFGFFWFGYYVGKSIWKDSRKSH